MSWKDGPSWLNILLNIILIIGLPLILIRLLTMPFTIIDKFGGFYITFFIICCLLIIIAWVVLFIRGKEKLPYWLKGTSIGVGLYILLLTIVSVPEFIACESARHSSNGLGMCGLFTAWAMIILLVVIPLGLIIGFIVGIVKQNNINSS